MNKYRVLPQLVRRIERYCEKAACVSCHVQGHGECSKGVVIALYRSVR